MSSLLLDVFSSLYSLCFSACAALIHPTPSVHAASRSLSSAAVDGSLKHMFASATRVSANAPVCESLQPWTTPAMRSPTEKELGGTSLPRAETSPEKSHPMTFEGGRDIDACLSEGRELSQADKAGIRKGRTVSGIEGDVSDFDLKFARSWFRYRDIEQSWSTQKTCHEGLHLGSQCSPSQLWMGIKKQVWPGLCVWSCGSSGI